MIISREQARLAAEHLRDHAGTERVESVDVCPQVIAAACAAASYSPDPRAGRVRKAAERLDAGEMDAHDIAEKMIARIISDSLR